ncbi:ribonuclease T2-like [Podila verticillata]|nr:ribonuclease T2-like [Podila verticillata]
MKFTTTAPPLVVSLLAAVSARPTNSLERRAGSCPQNVLSCPAAIGNMNSCCVPKHGLVVHSQQWHRDLGPNDKFTIHGLWPNDCDGSFRNSVFCDPNREYPDVENILIGYSDKRQGFLDDMYKYWPSYEPSPQAPDFNDFWSKEWGKHGTCVSTLDPSCMDKDMAVYSYFDKVLELREEYDIYAALAAHNITPGDTYPVDEVINAIEQELNVGAAVSCKHARAPLEFHLFFLVENKDQYKPATRPGNTEKAEYCFNNEVYYQKKSP